MSGTQGEQQRLALVGTLGETDVIRNGRDVWVWTSNNQTAAHTMIPAESARPAQQYRTPEQLPKTPQEAAQLALAAIDPTTSVTTSGASVVAGRDAYDLVLKPKDTASRVGRCGSRSTRSTTSPCGYRCSARTANPAFEVAFKQVSFAKPAARQFAFNPPPGTKVTQSTLGSDTGNAPATKPALPSGQPGPGRGHRLDLRRGFAPAQLLGRRFQSRPGRGRGQLSAC